jgi:hypothetical protein
MVELETRISPINTHTELNTAIVLFSKPWSALADQGFFLPAGFS